MSTQDELDTAFEEFLKTRRDHRDGLTARQQLWMAFAAGAQFTLRQVEPDGAPYCSYGHRTKAQCDCGPIAANE